MNASFIVTGGAWGAELQARGPAAGECPGHWNLTRPEAVRAVAAAYADGGRALASSCG